jgi:hypothetical protein
MFCDFVAWRSNARARWPGEALFSRHASGCSSVNDDPHGTDESVEWHTAAGRKGFMNREKSSPPRLAIWLLRHVCPGSHNQALTGDLVEKFQEGRSHGWFWKQVLIAIALGVLGEIRQHWPHFSYAIAGMAMPAFLGKTIEVVPHILHWWVLPWPLSQLLFEWTPDALLALAALPVLAAALVINRAFRWVSLLRTAMICLLLIRLEHYLPDVFPSLLHPMAGNPHLRILVIPPVFAIVLFFSTFFASAWLGCRSPRQADELEEQAKS